MTFDSMGHSAFDSNRTGIGIRQLFWVSALTLVALVGLIGLAGETEAADLWFDYHNFTVSDGSGDGYNDTLIFRYDIDTDDNETGDALILVNVTNELNGTVYFYEIRDYDINGTADEDLSWSWSCLDQDTIRTGNYTFEFQLLNQTGNQTFETLNTTVWLEAAEEAWFENKSYLLSASYWEGYNDTIHWNLPLVTRDDHTQAGFLRIYVFSPGLPFNSYDLDYSVKGNTGEPLRFNWTAEQTANYTFYFRIYNATDGILHSQQHVVELVTFPPAAWIVNASLELFESDMEGYNDTVHWTLPLVTWDEHTQNGSLRVTISNATLDHNEVANIDFNITGNSSQPVLFNWTARRTADYTFTFELFDEGYVTQLYDESHLVQLTAFPRMVWFNFTDHWFEDRENDTFEETIHFLFDLYTFDNWTQEGWLDISVYDTNMGGLVNSSSLHYNITGNVSGDRLLWNWSTDHSERYLFLVELYNETRELFFTNLTFSLRLRVPYEFMWLDLDSTRVESRFSFVDLTVDIDTWNNWTQEFVLNITVFNGFLPHIEALDSITFRANITGEAFDPFIWRWNSTEDGDYTFGLLLYNIQGELFNSRLYEFHLYNASQGAWLDSRIIRTLDLHGDGHRETVELDYDIDTFAGHTQAGYLNLYILNERLQTVYHNSPGIPYNVTSEADELETWSWSTDTDGTFTLYLQLLNETASLVYHEENLTFSLLAPEEAAWFAYKDHTLANGTLNFTFNVDTWSKWSQEGAVLIDVLTNGTELIDNSVLLFLIHGTANNDLLYWNWTARTSGNYTIAIYIVTRDLETTFHSQSHQFQLSVPVIVPNRPPTAIATAMLEGEPATQTADKLEVETGQTVTLVPANVNDPDGDDLTFVWTIEGQDHAGSDTAEGEGRLAWTFDKGGTYVVTLTVQDGRGGDHSDEVTVVVVRTQLDGDDEDDDGGSGWGAFVGLLIVAVGLVIVVVVAARNKAT